MSEERICMLCAGEAATHVVEYVGLYGPATNYLCVPCVGATLNRQWTKKHKVRRMNNNTRIILRELPKTRKCAACGGATVGAHWHFQGERLRKNKGVVKNPDRSGRYYFCDAEECCPLDHSLPRSEEWDDFDWDDEGDEFVFGEDDEDEYVFD